MTGEILLNTHELFLLTLPVTPKLQAEAEIIIRLCFVKKKKKPVPRHPNVAPNRPEEVLWC